MEGCLRDGVTQNHQFHRGECVFISSSLALFQAKEVVVLKLYHFYDQPTPHAPLLRAVLGKKMPSILSDPPLWETQTSANFRDLILIPNERSLA